MLSFIRRLMDGQVMVRQATVLLLAILVIYLLAACSPESASPTPQSTAAVADTLTITITITSTPTPLVVGSASSARRPTRTPIPTPRRATALALTLTRQAALTLTRPAPTATPRLTNTRPPTISPTWFEKIYPTATLRRWPTFTRTPIPTRTPTRTPTFPSGKTAIFQRRQTQTALAITQTAVAANQLVLADADGTNPTVLFTASGDIPLLDGVDWFPDGSGVIFAGGYKPDRQLYIIQPLYTAPYPIFAQPTSDNSQPAWSPNTTGWLAFISAVEGHPKLFVMKDDGSVIYQLTGGTTFESYPSWQPGGSKIIYASEGANLANLYSLDVSWLGGAMPNPTPAPVKLPNQAGITEKASSHYSPDKDWVVYSALDANNHRRIFVMSTDTNGSTRLQLGGDPTSNESDPDWSPDGKTVIFISDRAGNPDIYTMDMRFLYNPDPQHNVPPPHSLNGATAAFESSPVFSPVDQRIVFISRIGP